MALITYLALTHQQSRTPPTLAGDLALEAEDVAATFAAFPGIFRKSKKTDAHGEHYYTLHARYAVRAAEAEGDDPQIRPDVLKMLIDFVSQRADAEAEHSRFEGTLRQARLGAIVAAVAAVIAACASVAAALVGG